MTDDRSSASTTCTDDSDVDCILTSLRDELPNSLPVYHCVKNAFNGSWGNTSDIKTDLSMSVADLTVLCHVPSLVPTVPGQKESFLYTNTLDPGVIRSFLRQPGMVDWQASSHCFLLTFDPKKQEPLPSVVIECVTARGYQLDQEGRCRMYVYSQSHKGKSSKSKLPKGLKIGKLDATHVQYVTAGWKFSTPYAVSTLLRNIAVFPSAAIFNEVNSQPVSWAMLKAHGGIGLEHTLPEYRKKSIEKVVLRELIEQVQQSGDTPYVLIEEGNEPALKAYKKLGFVDEAKCVLMWLKFSRRT
ncbi:glycine N-acyltransferase-like [Glandiceps talaboti]